MNWPHLIIDIGLDFAVASTFYALGRKRALADKAGSFEAATGARIVRVIERLEVAGVSTGDMGSTSIAIGINHKDVTYRVTIRRPSAEEQEQCS